MCLGYVLVCYVSFILRKACFSCISLLSDGGGKRAVADYLEFRGFSVLIIALEVYYSRCDWTAELEVDECGDDLLPTTTSSPAPVKK